MLKAGYEDKGRQFETPEGTPQGGVVSPLLSNILLTPFDKEMRRQGYQLTRWADDWIVRHAVRSRAYDLEARRARERDGKTRRGRCSLSRVAKGINGEKRGCASVQPGKVACDFFGRIAFSPGPLEFCTSIVCPAAGPATHSRGRDFSARFDGNRARLARRASLLGKSGRWPAPPAFRFWQHHQRRRSEHDPATNAHSTRNPDRENDRCGNE